MSEDTKRKFIYMWAVILTFMAFYNFSHNLSDSQVYEALERRVAASEVRPCVAATPIPTPQNQESLH